MTSGLISCVSRAWVALALLGACSASAPVEAPRPLASAPSATEAPSATAQASAETSSRPASPSRAPRVVVLVVDRSGSMSGAPLDYAKQALREAPDACPTCRIEVVVFDSAPAHLATYDAGGERGAYEKAVARLAAAGGTDAVPALREATRLLAKLGEPAHVVLFTDGLFPTQELDAALAELGAANATLSTIGLGSADARVLKRMATAGRGRAHVAPDASALPELFGAELRDRPSVKP